MKESLKNEKLGLGAETFEGLNLHNLEEVVNDLSEVVDSLEKSGREQDITPETYSGILSKLSNIKNIVKGAMFGLALLGGAQQAISYGASRYEMTAEGRHEDPETDRILDFITGAAELAEEDHIYFYQQLVRSEQKKMWRIFEQKGYDIEDLNELEENLPTDEAGLRERLRELYGQKDMIFYGEVKGDIDNRVDQAFEESIQVSFNYDPKLAETIRQLHERVGAPRIRWSAPMDNVHSQRHGAIAGAGRANYSFNDNTIYLTPGLENGTLGRVVLAEYSHAVQFNDEPIKSRVRGVIDIANTVITSVREDISLYQAQHRQYSTPGTIEYEAHEEIEKELKEEAEQLYNQSSQSQ